MSLQLTVFLPTPSRYMIRLKAQNPFLDCFPHFFSPVQSGYKNEMEKPTNNYRCQSFSLLNKQLCLNYLSQLDIMAKQI